VYYYFYVLLIYLYVLLRVDARSRETRRPTWWSTWNLKSKASCALDHFSLPNNVLVNHYDMLRLIWWDLIGFPSFVYPSPCRQMNYWVDLLLLYLVLGLNVTFELWSYSNFAIDLIIVHDKIIVLIGTWRTTRKNSATTRVEWDALGQVIRKAREGLPYLKGVSGKASLQSPGRSSGRTICIAFRTKDSYASFFLNS
jgi:hypothetical protein